MEIRRARELEARRAGLLREAAAAGALAVLVYATEGRGANLQYLANYAPIFGDAFMFLSDRRRVGLLNFDWDIARAREVSGLEEFIATFDLGAALVEVLREMGLGAARLATVGFERLPYPFWSSLRAALPSLDLVDVTPNVERARRIKSADEIALMRRAVAITEAGLSAAVARWRPQMTELELAAVADYEMKSRGASEVAFPTCVVSGPERAIPVGFPTTRAFRDGDVVMVDLGAVWEGYRADLTRTYVVGEPQPAAQEVYAAVEDIWRRVMAEIRPGTACRRLNDVAAAAASEYGYALAHRVGHGIGLHTSLEWPNLAVDEDALEPSMVLAIEPGVCVPGIGTLKIEDDVLVTPEGAEALSTISRGLTSLGGGGRT